MNKKIQNSLRSLSTGAIILAAATMLTSSLQAKEYEFAESEIRWTGSMPAKTHEGLISLKSIEADITDEGKVTALTAVVDMTSINVTDQTGKSRDKLTGHLSSKDFFSVEKYPTATFVLDEHKDGKFYGTLTIRDQSKKVALPAKVSGHPDRGWILVGDFDYNRIDFGVDYQNSGFLGFVNAAKSKLIDHMIDVSVSVTLEPKV
ncbi:YceI family protein [Coraliomargarita sp. W4R53]